ncbi:protein psiR-like isoform X3 [Halichondria panicea]|uniref:protein psiR-like isoform X3 n=1 Tax=Halichondria panicea TaxID=6063 RepID=UPI00312B8CBC
MKAKIVLLWSLAVCVCTSFTSVGGEFILTVNLVNYTNPTGLCAECLSSLYTSYPNETILVCCDELPFSTANCDNTGEGRCDTRFHWTIRPFGASLETRPSMGYFFTDCTMSPSTCPFSETNTTFGQGPTALLGVTPNPLSVSRTDLIVWTGQIQFFIQAIESRLPNIIDSLLIDLDNLQLGADFTEEMTFTGFHNVSHMTISFRVECSPGFCGPDCTTTPQNNPRVATCQADGTLTCTDNRLDPSPLVACSDCLYNLDITTDCSTCVQTNYDPAINCTACLPGYDIDKSCSTCINTNYDPDITCSTCIIGTRYDPLTNCASCVDVNFNPSDGCTSCLLEFYDLQTNCTQCLPNRDPSTNCTQCLPNRDPSTNCTQCLPNRDPSTNCSLCLPGWGTTSDCTSCLHNRVPSTNCIQCLPNRDPSTNCTQCLPNRDPSTNCTQCLPNRDPFTNCSLCLPGWGTTSDCTSCLHNRDPSTNCTQCLPNRDPSTNCTQCLPGWDITSDCTSCLPNRDPVTSCSLCLQPDRFTDTDCSVCALPGGDPATLCQTCLATNFDPTTNCSECIGNRDLGSSCSTCLPGYDSNRDCAVCLSERNISTICPTCLSGFTGSNCEPESSLSVGVVGGIAGGVGGVLLLIILVMAVLLILLTVRIRKSGNQDISTATTTDKEVTEVMEMNQNPVYSMGTNETLTTDHEANHTHQYETVDTPIEMNQNPVYSATNATNIEADYYENDGLGPTRNEQQPEYDYIQV